LLETEGSCRAQTLGPVVNKKNICGPPSKSIAHEKSHRHKYPEIAVRGGHWS
jgi:hypothetical protein